MAASFTQLIPPKQAENGQTIQYTVPTGTKAVIDKMTGTNTSASNATLSVNLVSSGGAAGNNNLIVKTRTIAAGEAYTFPELAGHTLIAGGTISTLASASSAITIMCSGREIT